MQDELTCPSAVKPGRASGRALTVLQVITPKRFSGAERAMTYLAETLVSRGHRVVVACKHNELLLRELARRGIEGQALPIRGKANLVAPLIIARFARRIGADVIHTHLSTASLWGSLGARLAGVPCVGHIHWLNHKYWYVFADRWIACSQGVRRHLIAQGLPADRIQVVYNGLDQSMFPWPPDGSAVRSELRLTPDQPVIGAVAHLSPHKGHVYLLDAVAQLVRNMPELCCLLVGEGKDEPRLRTMIGSLGLEQHVRLMGYQHNGADLMKAMDVVVLPSLREGLGIVLIEAGLHGKPAVASDIDGINEVVVSGETGLLVPPGDSEALAGAIESLLADRQRAQQLGVQARSRMEELFSLNAMAESTEAVYYQAIEQYGRGASGSVR